MGGGGHMKIMLHGLKSWQILPIKAANRRRKKVVNAEREREREIGKVSRVVTALILSTETLQTVKF